MIKFTKPEKLNGFQLRDELRAAGIKITDEVDAVSVNGEQMLCLDIAKSAEAVASEVVANHVGIDREPTIQEKLSSVGLNLNDLKQALGI
jgi:hypothetical protein